MSELCRQLHRIVAGLPKFDCAFDAKALPSNGIYFVFEGGETAYEADRIVGIASHAGDDQLPSRIEQIFRSGSKDRSTFRKNIGRAILNRDSDCFLDHWQLDLTTRKAREQYAGIVDVEKLRLTESLVTEYIQQRFRFAIVPMEEKDTRLRWESMLVHTVSICDECGPSADWLGRHSPVEKIRESGRWLLSDVRETPMSEGQLQAFESITQFH